MKNTTQQGFIMENNSIVYKVEIPGEDIRDLPNIISKVKRWKEFNKLDIWSDEYIDAEQIYKVDRFVQRVVEETGLLTQDIVSSHFKSSDTVFPDFMQLIKVKKYNNVHEISHDGKICQSLTMLTGKLVGNVYLYDLEDMQVEDELVGSYAIASYWTYVRNPEYKKWFISKYLRLYHEQS